jgi:pimeloyl-ACP methyl ester carboxylesterase
VTARLVEARALPPGGLAYEERGAGPGVLLVHGAGVGRGLWTETLDALGDGVRAVAYDRRAYGASGAPEPYGGTTVEEQAEDAARVIRALDLGPALVCGHELGALVCLDLLRRHGGLVSGAVVIEPPLLSLSAAAPEYVSALHHVLEEAARERGAAGAVEAYLEDVGGPGTLERLGPGRVDDARAVARALAADLGAGPAWQFSRRELRGLSAPVAVVSGRRSAPVRREAAQALARVLGCVPVEVDAGHLVPLEAPDAVAGQILAALGGGPTGRLSA